jgi:hypothetical protein
MVYLLTSCKISSSDSTTDESANVDIADNNQQNEENHETKSVSSTPRSRTDRASSLSSSPNIELVGWGNNSWNALGLGSLKSESDNVEPRAVALALQPRLRLEGIRQIACSPRHTLLLSGFGIVYTCGENSEGALGLGDNISR